MSMLGNLEGGVHFVCCVDMIERDFSERAEERDDLQDQVYSDDLDQRVQRAVDARLAAQRPIMSGGGGPMILPWSSAHEWEKSRADCQVPPLPEFGKKEKVANNTIREFHLYGRVKQEGAPASRLLMFTSAVEWTPQVQLLGIERSVKWSKVP